MACNLEPKKSIFWIILLSLILPTSLQGGIHTAPIVLPATTIRGMQYHPIDMYRIYRNDGQGNAIPIPFQIDERDNYGDFILPYGKNPNSNFSNGIFDGIDELSFMGNDVGTVGIPTKWAQEKPPILYELIFRNGEKVGAVYVGAFFSNPPPLSPNQYVYFDLKNAEIRTARYQYLFDNKNYLVVRDVNLIGNSDKKLDLINSSTFYLKTDFKYFLSFEINQRDIESELDAYKVGPVRAIARVNFNYSILKLNFDLGMYTEVSFFSNSMILPAIIDNPLDGPKSLSDKSLFYYGFALETNPKDLNISTNMPSYKSNSLLDLFKFISDPEEKRYWISTLGKDYFIYLEMTPSPQMRKDKNIPKFFIEPTPLSELLGRTSKPQPLGKSRVNLAVALELNNLSKGMHEISLQLFVENSKNEAYLNSYRNLSQWTINTQRVRFE